MRIEKLNAHEILMNELPTWFKPVFEYIELMEVYGAQLDTIGQNEEAIYNNFFIQTADEDTISDWEKIFGIAVRYGDTLEFRRERIIQKFIQTVPYTIWDFRDRLTALFGNDYSLTVDPVALTLKIVVTSDRYGAIDLLYDLIWDVVPAHLRVISNQQTTSYAVSDHYIGAFLAHTFVQTIAPGGN